MPVPVLTHKTVIAGLIVALIVAIWWAGDIKPANIPFLRQGNIELNIICCVIGDVLRLVGSK